MSKTKLTRWEQETIINYNNEEKTAIVYTSDPVIQRKLDKFVKKYPNDYKCTKVQEVAEDQFSKEYWLSSKKLISFRAPVVMTEEQKAKAAARLAAYKASTEQKEDNEDED